MATAPQPAQEMPQQGANPFADPNTMAVYEQMRQTVSPKEFGDQMLAGAEQAAPEEVAAFRSALEQIEMPPEALELLNNMVDEILANPEQYEAIRAKYKEMGAPDEILPEQFDAQFFAALNMAVDQMIGEPAGVQAFAKGGIAELSPVSKAIAGYGRNGDTMLAHITPAEARMLRRKGGSGTINPKTGLPEFFNLFKEIGNAFKSIGNAVKKFASSTVGRIVTTVALGFFLGPAAASFMGATSTAAVAAVSGFVGSAGSTLLGGGNIGQALKAGAMGGLTAGIGAGVMGGADAFAAGSYTGPTTIGGQFDRFTQAISPASAAPAAPTDVLRDNFTTSTARDAYGTELAKTNPEVFNNPNAAPSESPFAAKKITLGGGMPEQVTMPNGAVVTQNAANPFAPTATNYGAFGEAPINASANTAAVGNTVAPPINAQPPAMASAATGNAIAPSIGNAADATQFPGSFDKTGIMSTQEPGFFDKAKGFFDKYISPSNIQQQGIPAAEQAGLAARDAMLARTPTATPAMLENAYQTAYKATMPGILSTYGPATALGIGAIGAFGGFTPKSAPISPYQSLLTGGPGSARDLMNKNPNRFYVQNLPGVNYYDGSVLKPTGMATGGLADIAKMGRDGDTMLAHINPAEAQMLKRMGGRGTINPNTGLPEFAFRDDDYMMVSQDYGGDFDSNYDFGDFGGGDDSIYTGDAGNTAVEAPYDPYADEGPSQSNPNVVGGSTEGTADQGEMTITGKRMYNVGDESVFDPTYGGILSPVIGGGGESVFDPGTTFNTGNESVFDPGTTFNTGNESVFDPGTTFNTGNESVFDPGTTFNTGNESVFDPGTTAVTTDVVTPEVVIPVDKVPPGIPPKVIVDPEPPVVVTPPPLPPPVVVEPPVPPTVVTPPVVTPVTPRTAAIDPRVAGVAGGQYLFTKNTPTFPTGSLSRTMSPYDGITGLMSRTGPLGEFSTRTVAPVTPVLPVTPTGGLATLPTPQFSQPGIQRAMPTNMNMGGIAGLAQGGYPRRTGQINGPGTATSDSIPAMLSDGEFVMTAKAVRGAGKGDRRAGAKRMYALMNQLEKNAARG